MSITLNHGEARNVIIVEDQKFTWVIWGCNGVRSRFPAKAWKEAIPPTLPHNTPAQIAARTKHLDAVSSMDIASADDAKAFDGIHNTHR